MSLESEIAADFESLAAEHGVSVTWMGITFSAMVSRARLDQQIDIGGFVSSYDMTLRALKASFSAALPEIGDIMTVDGTAYRSTKISNHPRSPLLLINLSTPDE
jgi:hypothetical protein